MCENLFLSILGLLLPLSAFYTMKVSKRRGGATMTKQQDFSMWSVNFILFCLANFCITELFICIFRYCRSMWRCWAVHLPISGWLVALSACRPLLYGRILGKLANEWGRKRMMLLVRFLLHCCFCCSAELPAVPLVVLRLAHGVCLAMYLAASAAHIKPIMRR